MRIIKLINFPSLFITTFTGIGCLLSTQEAQAQTPITAPYSDFDGVNSDTAPFVTTAKSLVTANWDASSGQYAAELDGFNFAGNAMSGAVLNATNIGGAGVTQNFTFSSNVTVNSYTDGGPPNGSPGPYSIGLVGLSNTQYIFNGGHYYYAYVDSTGLINIGTNVLEGPAPLGDGLTLVSSSNLTGGLLTGKDYTLTLQGTYSGSSLTLDFTVTDGTNSGSLIATTTTPLDGTGADFGNNGGSGFGVLYGLDFGPGSGASMNVTTSNFDLTTVVAPEPSAWSMLLIGVGVLVHTTLRRRAKV